MLKNFKFGKSKQQQQQGPISKSWSQTLSELKDFELDIASLKGAQIQPEIYIDYLNKYEKTVKTILSKVKSFEAEHSKVQRCLEETSQELTKQTELTSCYKQQIETLTKSLSMLSVKEKKSQQALQQTQQSQQQNNNNAINLSDIAITQSALHNQNNGNNAINNTISNQQENDIHELEAEVFLLQKQLEKNELQIKADQRLHDELQDQLCRMGKIMAQEKEDTEAFQANKNKQINDLQAENAQLKLNIEKLKQEVSMLQNGDQALSDSNKAEHQDLQQENKEIKKKMQESHDEFLQLNNALENKIIQLRMENDEKQQKISKIILNNATLQQSLELTVEQNNSLQANLQAMEGRLREEKRKTKDYTKQLKKIKGDSEKAKLALLNINYAAKHDSAQISLSQQKQSLQNNNDLQNDLKSILKNDATADQYLNSIDNSNNNIAQQQDQIQDNNIATNENTNSNVNNNVNELTTSERVQMQKYEQLLREVMIQNETLTQAIEKLENKLQEAQSQQKNQEMVISELTRKRAAALHEIEALNGKCKALMQDHQNCLMQQQSQQQSQSQQAKQIQQKPLSTEINNNNNNINRTNPGSQQAINQSQMQLISQQNQDKLQQIQQTNTAQIAQLQYHQQVNHHQQTNQTQTQQQQQQQMQTQQLQGSHIKKLVNPKYVHQLKDTIESAYKHYVNIIPYDLKETDKPLLDRYLIVEKQINDAVFQAQDLLESVAGSTFKKPL